MLGAISAIDKLMACQTDSDRLSPVPPGDVPGIGSPRYGPLRADSLPVVCTSGTGHVRHAGHETQHFARDVTLGNHAGTDGRRTSVLPGLARRTLAV